MIGLATNGSDGHQQCEPRSAPKHTGVEQNNSIWIMATMTTSTTMATTVKPDYQSPSLRRCSRYVVSGALLLFFHVVRSRSSRIVVAPRWPIYVHAHKNTYTFPSSSRAETDAGCPLAHCFTGGSINALSSPHFKRAAHTRPYRISAALRAHSHAV